MDRFKVGIVGADTAVGAQLARLLLRHPVVELVALGSLEHAGRMPEEFFPALRGLFSQPLCSWQRVVEAADVVFGAEPLIDGQELAAACIKDKDVFIDLGPALRLYSEEEHTRWLGTPFLHPGLHDAAIYGLPELMRGEMSGKVLVGVPGAAATASLLALAPLMAEGLIEPDGINISAMLPAAACDGSTGELGAFLPGQFIETAEIEQLLSDAAEKTVRVLMTPHSVSAPRGVAVTCFAKAALAADRRTLRSAYERYYGGERFVRVLPEGVCPDTASVIGSNVCDIGVRFDERTGRVVAMAALDRLMKGSAGQAVQCMNRLLSMPEEIAVEELPML